MTGTTMLKAIKRIGLPFSCFLLLLSTTTAYSQRKMDKLGRGVVAVRSSATAAFISWRSLATDPQSMAFNVYKSVDGAAAVKLNSTPLTDGTNYLNAAVDFTKSNSYFVKPVLNNIEQAASAAYTLAANTPNQPYIGIPLQPIADGEYYVHLAWPGDLDGNGEYDFVVTRLPAGTAGNRTRKLDGYLINGTFKWRIDVGPNVLISSGHDDGVTVYDMNNDGKAEIIVRTSEGTVFGDGTIIGDVNGDGKTDYRVNGEPVGQPEFISVVNGATGAEMSRIPLAGTGHFGIGYFDGIHPSFVFERVFANASNVTEHRVSTFDYVNGALTPRWEWTWNGVKYQFFHQIRIADIDNDGKDEFCEGGFVLDDDGTLLYSTELGHGDRFHISDIDLDNPGLETFAIQQDNPNFLATVIYDSKTGKMLKKNYLKYQVDVGRGDAADIDPTYKGVEMWTASTELGTQTGLAGQSYAAQPSYSNMAIWWDGDLLRETLNRQLVDKWNYVSRYSSRLLTAYNWGATYSWRDAAPLYGDFIGDWREEILYEKSDHTELQLFTTTIPSTNRIYCLMQNPEYRLCATVRGYLQSNQLDYFLGDGMQASPRPPVFNGDLIWKGNAANNVWNTATLNWKNDADTPKSYIDTLNVLFDRSGINTVPVAINSSTAPKSVVVHSGTNYTFSGTGALTGSMELVKAGSGVLTVNTINDYTGATTVNEGMLRVNGKLLQSPVTVESRGIVSGTGSIESGLVLNTGAILSPGYGADSAGTTLIKNGLTCKDNSTLSFDLNSEPAGITNKNDKITIEGNLVFGSAVLLNVNQLQPVTAGTYTLMTYTGTRTGVVDSIRVRGLEGIPYTLSDAGGSINLVITLPRLPANIIWKGNANGHWDVANTSNWLYQGNTAIFLGRDTVTFDDAGMTTAVNVTTSFPVGPVSVAGSKNYSFAGVGSITGSQGLTKTGTGKLTIDNMNTYKGVTSISGGEVEVHSLNLGGLRSPLGAADSIASNFLLSNGASLRLNFSLPNNTDKGITLGTGGGKFDVPNNLATINGSLTGTGSLTKAGVGTLAISGINTYSGGTVVNEGNLQLSSINANTYGLGTGSVTINGGALSMLDTWEGDYDAVNTTGGWNLIVPAGKTGRLNAAGRCILTGSLTGAGNFEMYTEFIRTELRGNWSAFTGEIKVLSDADGGDFRISNTTGYGNAALNLGDKVSAYYLNTVSSSGTVLDAGAITGLASSYLRGGPTGGRTLTWRVGAKNTDATYPGTITESSASTITAIQKVGTGTWTISGPNAYTGATAVNAGRLLVNNATGTRGTGSGVVTVASGAVLGGTGFIKGAITINTGGKLQPGSSAIGTFTDSTSVTLNTDAIAEMEVNKTASTVDLLKVTGALKYDGKLIVTKLDNASYAAGDTFKLFQATSYTGNFSSIEPATPATGLKWDTTSLRVNGVLKIVSANPLPVTLLSFKAVQQAGTVLLKWETATEINNDRFVVERSADGIMFTTITEVKGAGNSTTNLKYTSIDNNPALGINYYRIRQVDKDGRSSTSKVELVNIASLAANGFVIYPNPTKSYVQLSIQSAAASLELSITSLDGKLLFKQNGSLERLNGLLKQHSSAFASGTYLVKLVSGNNLWVNKFIKQ